MNLNNRYQYQPFLVKLWRRRHYLPIPYWAVRFWIDEKTRTLRDEKDWRLSFRQCWGWAIGSAHVKMNWIFTSQELEELGRE